jgi:hypothetical protein
MERSHAFDGIHVCAQPQNEGTVDGFVRFKQDDMVILPVPRYSTFAQSIAGIFAHDHLQLDCPEIFLHIKKL